MKSDALFRCLGDPTRLRILQEIARAPDCCVSDVVETMGAPQSNVSHHLAQLRACGLVVGTRDGKRICYRLAHPGLREWLAQADDIADHIACCSTQGCC